MRGVRRLTVGAVLVYAVYAAFALAAASLPKGEGADLYLKKCGKCHRPYAPAELDAEKWEKQFPEMKKRARLSDEQTATIRRYVESNMPSPPPHG